MAQLDMSRSGPVRDILVWCSLVWDTMSWCQCGTVLSSLVLSLVQYVLVSCGMVVPYRIQVCPGMVQCVSVWFGTVLSNLIQHVLVCFLMSSYGTICIYFTVRYSVFWYGMSWSVKVRCSLSCSGVLLYYNGKPKECMLTTAIVH